VSDRNARSRWNRNCARYAWNDLNRDASVNTRLRFFATATKDERVSALQAHNAAAFECFCNDDLVDAVLRRGMCTWLLANINDFYARSEMCEWSVWGTSVNDHCVCESQHRTRAYSQEIWISGAGTN
jgi:hypothetical protein